MVSMSVLLGMDQTINDAQMMQRCHCVLGVD
jgi:hypothetical protein